jgi:hypothetical protein
LDAFHRLKRGAHLFITGEAPLFNLNGQNTRYVNQRLEPFYSDLVYRTTMTDQNGTKKPSALSLIQLGKFLN